jgi:hypothetical protein
MTNLYHLNQKNDFESLNHILNTAVKRDIQFIHQKKQDFITIENDLVIAPVAALQENKKSKNIFGVFADRDFNIHGELCLGEYIGEIVDTESTKNKSFDADYAFDLGNGTTIDAKYYRSWPAMVNATSSYESSNVMAKSIDGRVYYFLIRPVKKGEQLLIYYGDDYTFKHKKFLNPNDNWEESEDKFQKYASYYASRETTDRTFLDLFELKTNRFAIPEVDFRHRHVNVDIPILAYQTNEKLYPQRQQENITLLMLACWQGNIENVRQLLIQSANPYQQTNIHGYSALHLLVLSPHVELKQKQEIIDLMLSYAGQALKLQNHQDETILHLAIKTHQVALVGYILEKNRHITRYGLHNKSILDYLNHDNHDAFMLALTSLKPDIVREILPYVREEDLQYTLENQTILSDAFERLKQEHSSQNIQAFITSIIADLESHERFFKEGQALSTLLKKCIVKKRTIHSFFSESQDFPDIKRPYINHSEVAYLI